jgi:hypothetical protein
MSFWQDLGALFTPTEKTKLAGIEDSATTDQTGAEIRDAVEAATDSNTFTDADHTKLNGVDTGATNDQTGGEIKTAYEGEADTNAYNDAAATKLGGVETSADVTDAENVRTSGAVMRVEGWYTAGNMAGWDSVQIGTIPANCYVLRTFLHVTTAFTGSGAILWCGDEGDMDGFGTSTDITSTGIKTMGAGGKLGYNSAAMTIEVTGFDGGEPDTVGKAICGIEYMKVTQQP